MKTEWGRRGQLMAGRPLPAVRVRNCKSGYLFNREVSAWFLLKYRVYGSDQAERVGPPEVLHRRPQPAALVLYALSRPARFNDGLTVWLL